MILFISASVMLVISLMLFQAYFRYKLSQRKV
jgi:hypothetical protein